MSVPADNNKSVKEYKVNRYKDLEIETEKFWHRASNNRSTGYDQERNK